MKEKDKQAHAQPAGRLRAWLPPEAPSVLPKNGAFRVKNSQRKGPSLSSGFSGKPSLLVKNPACSLPKNGPGLAAHRPAWHAREGASKTKGLLKQGPGAGTVKAPSVPPGPICRPGETRRDAVSINRRGPGCGHKRFLWTLSARDAVLHGREIYGIMEICRSPPRAGNARRYKAGIYRG